MEQLFFSTRTIFMLTNMTRAVTLAACLICLTLYAEEREIKFYNARIDAHIVDIPLEDEPKFSGVSGIDQIYYINLATRPERKKRIEALMHKHHFNATRVEAVNGKELLRNDLWKITGKKKYDTELTLGAIGCALSHFSIWRDAILKGYDRIWIMEDDIEIFQPLEKIPELLEKLSKLDPDWDILYTDPDTRNWDGTFLRQTHVPPMHHPKVEKANADYFFKREFIGDDFERIHVRIGAYSLIISKSGLEKLIKFHQSMELWTHVDVSIHLVPNIRQYVLTQPYITHTIVNRTSDTSS